MAANVRSVPLSEAWLEFWPTLFPDQPEWQLALANWVKTNLVEFDPQKFHRAVGPSAPVPQWADSFMVDVGPDGARVTSGGQQVAEGPWFSTELVGHHPKWMDHHPLQHLLAAPSGLAATANHHMAAEGSAMVHNVTLRAGETIRGAVTAALRNHRLSATGLSAADGYSDRRPITEGQLQAMSGVDLRNNAIEFSPGAASFIHVLVSDSPHNKGWSAKGGGFDDQDAPLVEEMRSLVESGHAVREAAAEVSPRAPRRLGADDESVIERLVRRYGRKYPSRRRL